MGCGLERQAPEMIGFEDHLGNQDSALQGSHTYLFALSPSADTLA